MQCTLAQLGCTRGHTSIAAPIPGKSGRFNGMIPAHPPVAVSALLLTAMELQTTKVAPGGRCTSLARTCGRRAGGGSGPASMLARPGAHGWLC